MGEGRRANGFRGAVWTRQRIRQMMLRDEAAELNQQIKVQQRQIAYIQNQIPKAPRK